MTSFRIEQFRFTAESVRDLSRQDPRFSNWPVVYALDDRGSVYVGESRNAVARLRQHLEATDKRRLHSASVVIDETFNKSVCLDLESYLIRLLAGDGRFQVLNRNEGITNADYYGRAGYQATFRAIFDDLLDRGLFTRPIRDIENSDLFKLSPFKALTQDQAIAVDDILKGLFDDLDAGSSSRIVIQGAPGTGKTVVAIYLMKLLSDIQHADLTQQVDGDSLLSEFFVPGYPELLEDFKVGLVVPQQSLRKSIQRVFRQTPGLHQSQVLTPFEVGNQDDPFDLLIVDEAHRLNQRAAQAAGPLNRMFRDINERLFGEDDPSITQLDWINYQSKHQLYLVDGAQSVRPADLSAAAVDELVGSARRRGRHYPLTSQMRVQAGQDYVGYVRGVLGGTVTQREDFPGYDLRMYDDLGDMRAAILERGTRGRPGTPRGGICLEVAEQERPRRDRHRARRPAPAVELRRRRLGELAQLRQRGRVDPHDPGLRPELRRRHHRPATSATTPPVAASTSTGRTTTIRAAPRTTAPSASPTPTTTSCSSCGTSTRCSSRGGSLGPTCTCATRRSGSICGGCCSS